MRWTLTALLVGVLIGQCTQLYAYLPVERNDDLYSSGAGDEDDDGGSSGNDVYPGRSDEGSGDPPRGRTRCEQMRDADWTYPGAYRPRCTADGEFEPIQCHEGTGSRECWCVRSDGQEISGTFTRGPNEPVCFQHGTRKTTVDPDLWFSQDTSTLRDHHRTSPAASDEVKTHPVFELRAFVRSEPLLLAGVIGGAVLLLLLIILILMFVVYRMRKKDEGSYSLDEPRHSFSYTRAKDQEFFA